MQILCTIYPPKGFRKSWTVSFTTGGKETWRNVGRKLGKLGGNLDTHKLGETWREEEWREGEKLGEKLGHPSFFRKRNLERNLDTHHFFISVYTHNHVPLSLTGSERKLGSGKTNVTIARNQST